MAAYLDCAATTPIDPHVLDVCIRYLRDDFGNAGSRTHTAGQDARRAVERARDQVAAVVRAQRGDVLFTSGATEANNLALLGLEPYGRQTGKTHLISTAIEHRAVLEPMEELERRGFTLTLVRPDSNGVVDPQAIADAIRPETLLVSVMQVNNETGAMQPIAQIAEQIAGSPVYFHTDASQGFAKAPEALQHPRIDLISISAHKICGPKGVGALIARRRGREKPPLQPLTFGGGQERGLRPGTLPVALIAALGEAAERWSLAAAERYDAAIAFRRRILDGLAPLNPQINGDPEQSLPFILNLSIPGFESNDVMQAWEHLAAVSSGAACSAQTYTCSPVLAAMGIGGDRAAGAIRISFCHLSELPDLAAMAATLQEARLARV
jgi:cysteine desulfurase